MPLCPAGLLSFLALQFSFILLCSFFVDPIRFHFNQPIKLSLMCCILRKTSVTMFVFAPFYLFACSVNAVKFFGDVPSVDSYMSTVNSLMEPVEDDFSIGSLFLSSDLTSRNGSDFLADSGIPDTTLIELVTQGKGLYTSAVLPSGLSTRDPADQLNCQNNQVVDKISPKNQKHICNIVKTLVGAGTSAVSVLIDSTVCSERSTGHPVKCHTIVAFIGFSGVSLSSLEVGDYCTEYLSTNGKTCGGQGVSGDTGNKRAHVAVANTQADNTACSGLRGKCTEINV